VDIGGGSTSWLTQPMVDPYGLSLMNIELIDKMIDLEVMEAP
jgi:hypothetical protein